MKILVTGGGGFLGKAICSRLINDGHRVTSFSRSFHSSLQDIGVFQIQGDLKKYSEVEKACSDIDVIFHAGALASMWGEWSQFYQANVVGTQNVIKACRKYKIKKLIYTSSPSVVFGKDDLKGVSEKVSYPDHYLSYYSKSKAMAEKIVLEANDGLKLLTVAIRPHLIWGPGDRHLVPRVLELAQKNKLRIIGNGNNKVDVTFIDNAVEAHMKAFQHLDSGSSLAGEAYFIADEKPVFLWDFINKILDLNDIESIGRSVSLKWAYCIGAFFSEAFYNLFKIFKKDPPMTRFVALQLGKSHYFDHSKAYQDFGYRPIVSLEEGLNRLGQNKTL